MLLILPMMGLIGGSLMVLIYGWDWKRRSKRIILEKPELYGLYKLETIRGVTTGILLFLIGVFTAVIPLFKN